MSTNSTAEYQKLWRKKNHSHWIEYIHNYHIENHSKRCYNMRKYRNSIKGRKKLYATRNADKEHYNATVKAWRYRNIDKYREYQKIKSREFKLKLKLEKIQDIKNNCEYLKTIEIDNLQVELYRQDETIYTIRYKENKKINMSGDIKVTEQKIKYNKNCSYINIFNKRYRI